MPAINTEFPLKSSDFKYSPVIGEESIHFTSAYNMTNMTETRDLMHMFAAYDWVMWFCVLTTMFIVINLLMLGRHLLQKKKGIAEPTWIVTMFMLDQDYLHEVNAFLYVLSISLTFFSYFNTQYMLNNMSTDMIVILDPEVIQSYDDIISRENYTATWLKHYSDHEEFKNAPVGSIEHDVWQKALYVRKRTGRNFMLDFARDPFESAEFIVKHRGVYTMKFKSTYTTTIFLSGLSEDYDMKDLRFLIRKDPRAKSHLLAYPMSPKITKEKRGHINRRMQRMFETGIIERGMHFIWDGLGYHKPSIQEKFSDVILRNTAPSPSIGLINVRLVFAVMGIMICFTCTVLIIEMCHTSARPAFLSCVRRVKVTSLLIFGDVKRRMVMIVMKGQQVDSQPTPQVTNNKLKANMRRKLVTVNVDPKKGINLNELKKELPKKNCKA